MTGGSGQGKTAATYFDDRSLAAFAGRQDLGAAPVDGRLTLGLSIDTGFHPAVRRIMPDADSVLLGADGCYRLHQ